MLFIKEDNLKDIVFKVSYHTLLPLNMHDTPYHIWWYVFRMFKV